MQCSGVIICSRIILKIYKIYFEWIFCSEQRGITILFQHNVLILEIVNFFERLIFFWSERAQLYLHCVKHWLFTNNIIVLVLFFPQKITFNIEQYWTICVVKQKHCQDILIVLLLNFQFWFLLLSIPFQCGNYTLDLFAFIVQFTVYCKIFLWTKSWKREYIFQLNFLCHKQTNLSVQSLY